MRMLDYGAIAASLTIETVLFNVNKTA